VNTPPFSIHDSLTFGWEAFKAHYNVFIPVIFLTGVISVLSKYVGDRDASILMGVALILGAVAQIIVGMGLTKIALNITAGKPAAFDDIFSVTHLFFAYVGATILYGLIVLGGFLLLIIPGIMWLVSYWLFQYALVDKGLGVLDALSEAKRISKDVRWPLFKFMVVTGVLNIVGIAAFGIGLFVTIPITAVATAYVYRALQKRFVLEQTEEEKTVLMQTEMAPSVNS
jgi:uncharacterized membrane protein